MKSYHANSGSGIAGLTVKEYDEPKPGPREVLIRVRAVRSCHRSVSLLRRNRAVRKGCNQSNLKHLNEERIYDY